MITASYLKAGLVELCAVANGPGTDVDPGGLLKDSHAVLQEHKLIIKWCDVPEQVWYQLMLKHWAITDLVLCRNVNAALVYYMQQSMPCYEHNDSNVIPDVKLYLKAITFLQKPKMVYLQTSIKINSSINGHLNMYFVIQSQIMKTWCPLLSLHEPMKAWTSKCWSHTWPSFCLQMIYQGIMLGHQKNINWRSVGGKMLIKKAVYCYNKTLSFFSTGHLNSHTWPVISNGIITKDCGHHWFKSWPVAWWW